MSGPKQLQDVMVVCCYCSTRQSAPYPPCLVNCGSCGREFRVLKMGNKYDQPMDLSPEARRFYYRQKDRSA